MHEIETWRDGSNYYIRENVLMTIFAFMKRLAVVIQPATSSWQVNNPGDNLWPSDIVEMNAFSRSGRRELINETRNSMIPEVFPMIQSSNDSFLQLERWVTKNPFFEGWPCYWDEFAWPGFRRLKICLSMLSLFNKYMKSMSEILAVDELYFTAAYIDLHIWSICILGSQTCYPGREEIASTLACASFVGLVEALPAWRSRGIFCFFAWIPGLQTARVLSRQLTIAEPKWQRAFGHQHYNFASSSFYAARFFASS